MQAIDLDVVLCTVCAAVMLLCTAAWCHASQLIAVTADVSPSTCWAAECFPNLFQATLRFSEQIMFGSFGNFGLKVT